MTTVGQDSGAALDQVTRLFAGPGEMRARCRAFDWASTPLGPVEGWPPSLRTAVGLCLASGFPMLVMWGPELVQVYNDAFRSVLQAKHPAGLGQRARDCWPELWAMIGPMYQGVLDTGVSIFLEDQVFTPERRGEPGVAEEAYFTFSYSAIPDEAGQPAGILATVIETTRHVLSRGERERALERANTELRAAASERERLLVESEAARARVTATLESIGDAFYAVDADFRFTYVNRKAEALWGRSRELLLGRHYWSEFPQAVGSEAYHRHHDVMRERRPVHFEAVSPIVGRWVDVSLYPDPVGGGLACYFRDITDRKAAEAALRESEARFRIMADAVPQIVWITDREGRTEFFNRQWTAYTGAPFEPGTAAQIAADFVHPDDAALTMERFERARRTSTVFEVEHRIRSAAGDYRWFLVRAEPYHDPNTGEVVHWFGGSVDIHDRREAEAERERLLAAERSARAEANAARAAAEAEQRRLAAVLDHLPVGVTFAEGPGGRHSISNPAAVAIWGMLPASPDIEAYSRDFVGFRPGPGARGSAEEAARRLTSEEWPLARALAKGELVQNELVEIERPDGSRRLVRLSAAPVPGADGRVGGALVTTVDVTERERLLADAQTARAEAESANRAKSEFLAVMSHELRTPLNAIGGYTELIELGIHGPVTAAQRVALDRIQQSQRHLLGLISGVLDYSRVEAGAVSYHTADLPVGEVVAEAEVLVGPQLRAKGLGYSWSGAPAGLAVRADREKLQQILLNLLGNAVKFTGPREGVPGRIDVACTVDEGARRVHLHVRDTGIGIAPEQLERIFEPFVQADQRLTRRQEGVGLGLAISRDLARGMDGDLTAASTPGLGSTFTVTLPMA